MSRPPARRLPMALSATLAASLLALPIILSSLAAAENQPEQSQPEQNRSEPAPEPAPDAAAEPAPQPVQVGAPVPPADAAAKFSLPEGFSATLFAGEPDVVQPIAFTIDHRGRLWVAECYSYPTWIKDPAAAGKDRVLIFEDTDNDGRFDQRKVFTDTLKNLSGLQVGFGGVYVCSTPNFLFIADANGDDAPDGEPQVLLDGWNIEKAGHNVFNKLVWGPDGWLYGCNGIQSESLVGKPGTPPEQRVALNCGAWRYHPTRHEFEAVAHGTTNPFGLDYDAFGRLFITNCVIAHLFHVIPGAHYDRMYGEDINPHSYALMKTCADHLHWPGDDWTKARGAEGPHAQLGGGHAHTGAMVYLGDNWPDEYRGNLFTCNIHGNRVNRDLFEPARSGVVARHGKDFLLANDTWFRGLDLQYGPDGGVYLTDWSDTGECHDFDHCDTTNGRIFKITHGGQPRRPSPELADLAKLDDAALVLLQTHRNDWYPRTTRRLLQERHAAGKLDGGTHALLRVLLDVAPDAPGKLRALWCLHATGGVNEELTLRLLDSPEEHVRGWAVQLELEDRQAPEAVVKKMAEMAQSDASPVVRLYLASALQRLPLEQRWPVAQALVARAEDVDDPNLPLMIWYGVEPLVMADKAKALGLVAAAKIPVVREHIARRLASSTTPPAAAPSGDAVPPADPGPSENENPAPAPSAP